jgi:hypothetical protein
MGHLNLGNILFMFHHIHGTFKFREFGAAASSYFLVIYQSSVSSVFVVEKELLRLKYLG